MTNRTELTVFQLPIDPEEFSVPVTPAELVKIDYSALEFETVRRALIEYIKLYYPDDFNDFVSNNGVMMLVEAIAYVTANLSLRGDILANEAFLPTATTMDAVVNHLALIGQKVRRATPASVDISCTINSAVSADINIPAGLILTAPGDDGSQITYEVYKSPDDFNSAITIPAGKRGVIAYGIEGTTQNDTLLSAGGANQQVVIYNDNILESPVTVTTTSGGLEEKWDQIDVIEKALPNDKVYEIRFYDDRMILKFGDNINGQQPDSGVSINVTYRVGGGVRGRVGSNVLSTSISTTPEPPFNAPVNVKISNESPSVGGFNAETIKDAKRRAPREFATHNSIITKDDYTNLSSGFSHPVFGTVSKAVATVRTGINANRVEVYVLAEGANSAPVLPTTGLKEALKTYLDNNNPITDEVVVLNGAIKYVPINMNVIMDKNAEATVVKMKVESAIDNFFDISQWDMGEAFYQSQFINAINSIDGVGYIDLFEPSDNILPTSELSDSSNIGVGINEVIYVGEKKITYYYNS